MSNVFSKIKFTFSRQPVVVVAGRTRKSAYNAVVQVLKNHFKLGQDVLVFESDDGNIREYESFLKDSRQGILVVTNVGDIPFDSDFFAGDRELVKNAKTMAQNLPDSASLVLNFDDETSREIGDNTGLKTLTFGLQKEADFTVSDINVDRGVNFKVNYKGKIVPVWLEKTFGREQIYSAAAACCVGNVLGLNLVDASEALKFYETLDGRMKLVNGIKHSFVVDDSESASVFSMAEAIEILGKLKGYNRRIAVLGDVVGAGKYTIEAHEAMGERIARNADILFAFGARAKFIAKGAREKGMDAESVFEFDTVEEGKLKLQDVIEENDVILVDGSREMKMSDVVKEIRA